MGFTSERSNAPRLCKKRNLAIERPFFASKRAYRGLKFEMEFHKTDRYF